MILQVLNIVGGTLLASNKIAAIVGPEKIAKMQTAVLPYRTHAGIVLFISGLLGLIERLGIVYVGIANLGSSFPQAIAAILAGLLLGATFFGKFPQMQKLLSVLTPYSSWIGIIALAIGLGSMLFGCMAPVCFPLSF